MELIKVNNYEIRLKALQFESNFSEYSFDLKKKLLHFNSTLDKVRDDESIKELLKYCLAVGNFLNGSSAKGDAYGFKLESFEKTTDTKSLDGKQTVLMYIIKQAEKDLKKELVKTSESMEDVDFFRRNSFKVLGEELNEIRRGKTFLQKAIESQTKHEQDMVEMRFKTLHVEVTKRISELEDELAMCQAKYETLSKFYGEDTTPSEVFFEKISKMKNVCIQAKLQIIKLQNLKEKEEEKKRLQELQEQKQLQAQAKQKQKNTDPAPAEAKMADKNDVIEMLKQRRSSKATQLGNSSLKSLLEMQKKLKAQKA